jgi:hypothetical protein
MRYASLSAAMALWRRQDSTANEREGTRTRRGCLEGFSFSGLFAFLRIRSRFKIKNACGAR